MIINGYCTREELQGWNQAAATAQVDNLDRAVAAASRGIDEFCQRHYWQTSAGTARMFDTCDPNLLKLGCFNDVVTITSVRTDENRDGVYETTWSASDWQPGPLNPAAAPEPRPWTRLRAIGARRFPRRWTGRDREGLIEITGTWGWPAIPSDVNQACLILAARYYKRKESPDGVSNWNEIGVIRISRSDPDVIELLVPYRHPEAVLAA